MEVIKTPIEDLLIIKPKVFGDHRGFFMESYNQKTWSEAGLDYNFVQDNRSFSKKGTLRGLHFQTGESSQAKLVTCLSGEVLDVAVDLRSDSKTYGEHFTIELNAEEKTFFLVPRGFAHGFIVLSETAEFFYKCDNYYDPANEAGIIYNDPTFNIDWKIAESKLILSEKDTQLPTLEEYKSKL